AVPQASRRRLRWPGRNRTHSTPLRDAADETVRRMRADLYVRKEEAVQAVAAANMLQRVIAQQERSVAEKELQALAVLRDGNRETALRSFQESRMYAENLERTRPLLEPAARKAEELLAVFKAEEGKLKSRERADPSNEHSAIEAAYAQREIR